MSNDARDFIFNKTRIDWAMNPETTLSTDVLSIPDLTRKQRLDLYEARDRISKRKPEVGFQNFNTYYAQAYGKLPTPEELSDNTAKARHYYRAASGFYDDIEKTKAGNDEVSVSDDEYNILAKGSLTKMAVGDAATGQGYTNLTDDMRNYLSKGLASQNIPVTDENLQKIYRFYMARTLSNG